MSSERKAGSRGGQIDLRHAEQYAGVWAMEPVRFARMRDMVRSTDLFAHVRSESAAKSAARAAKVEARRARAGNGTDVHIIEIRGTMTKYGSSLSGAPATMAVTREVREISANGSGGIVLVLDSPGGTVAGTRDLFDALMAASSGGTPCVAFCEDMAASAAYYAACGCDHIVCNAGGEVGSIGALMVIDDVSEYYAKAGVKTEVFASTGLKGAGVEGTSLSDDQRAEMQRYIEEHGRAFTEAVAMGRGVDASKARSWSDARMHRADVALEMGLLDTVGTLEDAIEICGQLREQRDAERTETMARSAKTVVGVAGGVVGVAANADEPKKPAPGPSGASAASHAAAQAVIDAASDGAETVDDDREDDADTSKNKDKDSGAGGQLPATTGGTSGSAPGGGAEAAASASQNSSVPATPTQLRALGAGSDFAFACLEGRLTLAQATPLAELFKAESAKASAAGTGNPADRVVGGGEPVGGSASGPRGAGASRVSGAHGKDPDEDFDASADVRALCKRVGLTKQSFVSWAKGEMRSDPNGSYLAELSAWAKSQDD